MWIITGANGFIGSAMVWEFNRHGREDLWLTDHITPQARSQLLKPLRYQKFSTADALLTELKQSKNVQSLSGIVHMGACSTTTEMDVEYLRRNNTEYTQELWSVCVQAKIPFIYASSGAVYGDGRLGFDDAASNQDYQPLNPYGWSKLHFDQWAQQQPKAPPRWYGLRFFNVYGPNEYHKGEQSSVVYKAFQQIRQTGKLKLFRSHRPDYKDGEQLRDFVYVKDVTHWMWQLVERTDVASGIYNMGYGTARSWLNLASAVFENLRQPMAIDWIDIPENIRNQYQYFTEAKMQRLLAQKLNNPLWNLSSGVKDYVNQYLVESDPHLHLP